MREIFIAVVLAGLGAWLLWRGYRFWQSLMSQASQISEEPGPPSPEAVEVRGPVGPDGLVFLFAHDFVSPPHPGRQPATGQRAYAPLTKDALDVQEWACRLLYTVLAEQRQQDRVDFRITEQAATLMPPFPYKAWQLEVKRLQPLSASPLSDCMNVAFDMLHKRQRVKQASQGAEEPETEQPWCDLSELIEWVLKTVRTEMSFWQREGVCLDLCRYVQESLVGAGYLIEKPRRTWLERLRRRKFEPNQPAIESLEDEVESLKQRLVGFRRQCGSADAQETAEDLTAPIRDAVASDLMEPERPLDQLPLDDCLRLSVYQVVVELRDVEPKRGGM